MTPFVAEVYAFADDSIGERRRVLLVEAPSDDAKDALRVAASWLLDGEMLALYQGNLQRYGQRPIAFTGRWTVEGWKKIRDAHGGVYGVEQALRAKSTKERA